MGDGSDDGAPLEPRQPVPTATGSTLTVDLDWRTVVVALAAVTALGVALTVVVRAGDAATLVAVAVFLGLALDPIVVAVERRTHLQRGWAAAIVLLAGAAVAAVFVAVAADQIASQTKRLTSDLPETIDSIVELPLVGEWLRDHDAPARIRDALGSIPDRLAGNEADLGDLTGSLAVTTGSALLAFLLVAGVLLDGPSLVSLVRRAIPPADRATADQIGRAVYQVLARYFAGNLLLATLHGVWVSVTGVLLGIPLSPLLGVWAAITSLIPQIGGLLGFLGIFVVSLSQGIGPTIAMSLLFFVYMTFDNNVLLPVVVGRAVDVSAPVTMVAAIAGFSVAGVAGSLFAVPTIAALKAVAHYVRHRDEPDAEPPGRRPDDETWVAALRHRVHRR